MNRRRLLALCGSLVAGTGCVGFEDEEPTPQRVTPVPLPEVVDADEPAGGRPRPFHVTSATVQPGVVGFDSADSIGVYDSAGQYLLLGTTTDGPDRTAFTLVFDGQQYTPVTFGYGLYREGRWRARYEDGGPLVFALPETGDPRGTHLSWPGGQWTPPSTLRARLAVEPPPIAMSLDGPRSAAAGDGPELTVRVANKGSTMGRYVGALNQRGPDLDSAPVARLTGVLDAGGTRSHTFAAEPPDATATTTYTLDVPDAPADVEHTIYPNVS